MKQQSPRDIQKRTFDFGIRIVKLVDRLPRTLAGTEIGRQVLRSGVSVGANVQEADVGESKKDFAHKMGIARKEAQETRYWVGIIQTVILPSDPEMSALWREADELARILYTIIKNTRKVIPASSTI
jgi:four helix bundle protein